MLTRQTIDKIEKAVFQEPRSMQELALIIGKNWRTADRYVEEIAREYGTLSTKTFRGGTRGALKIIFPRAQEKISHGAFQLQLEKDIFRSRKKEDFSAFDMVQYIQDKNKTVKVKSGHQQDSLAFSEMADLYRSAKKQILIFSGNLSFANFKSENKSMLEVFEELVQRGVSIKILCRVDLVGKQNVEAILSLNEKYGNECIEIHHHLHALRASIIDGRIMHIKEVTEPTGQIKEMDKKLYIFYTITSKPWLDWIVRIFWKMWQSSIDAHTRLEHLKSLIAEV